MNHQQFWLHHELKSLRERRADVAAGDLNPYEFLAVAHVLKRAASNIGSDGMLLTRAEALVLWGERAVLA